VQLLGSSVFCCVTVNPTIKELDQTTFQPLHQRHAQPGRQDKLEFSDRCQRLSPCCRFTTRHVASWHPGIDGGDTAGSQPVFFQKVTSEAWEIRWLGIDCKRRPENVALGGRKT
jgi:hypothetical protein